MKSKLFFFFVFGVFSMLSANQDMKDLKVPTPYDPQLPFIPKPIEILPAQKPYQSLKPYHFKIQEKKYDFSSFFEIDSEDTYRGNVKKSSFRFRDCYDLSDLDGWCATGVKRIFSLGSVFNWAAEIDILGVNEEFLGKIEGRVLSTAKARFHLYNRDEKLVGIAHIDNDGRGVTISKPDNEAYSLARFARVFVQDISDHWNITVYEPKNLDDRLIRIFAAFCLDAQNSFHIDK